MVPTWDPERWGFLPLALLNYLYQFDSIGVLGVEMSCRSPGSLPFSSHKLSHRGLGINIHLGICTLPIVNKACGDVTSGDLKPQMLIYSHIKECIEAYSPTLTTWVIVPPLIYLCLPAPAESLQRYLLYGDSFKGGFKSRQVFPRRCSTKPYFFDFKMCCITGNIMWLQL